MASTRRRSCDEEDATSETRRWQARRRRCKRSRGCACCALDAGANWRASPASSLSSSHAPADYQNEAEVGNALAEAFKTGLVKREDLLITTKVR